MVRNHRYLPWRRAFLIPIWTIQLGSMGLIIALLAFAAGLLFRYDEYLSSSTKSAAKTYDVPLTQVPSQHVLTVFSQCRRNMVFPFSFLHPPYHQQHCPPYAAQPQAFILFDHKCGAERHLDWIIRSGRTFMGERYRDGRDGSRHYN